jgi:putative ABC transport system permease protein
MEAGNPNAVINVNHRLVTPGLFRAMGIPLLSGRGFGESDGPGVPLVCVVSARMARHFWPGADAIGKRIRLARAGAPWLTVVGVAGDVGDWGDPGDPRETWYLPYAQQALTAAAAPVHLMVRSRQDPLQIVGAVQQAVWRVDKNLATYTIAAMDRYYSRTLLQEQLGARVTGFFAAFGILLASLGVYGVMSFVESLRTRETAIRISLGAQRTALLALSLRRGLTLAGLGVLIGFAGAGVLNRVLANLLHEVGSLELTVYAAAAAVLLVAAALACYLPAARMVRIDPLVALRSE